MWNSVLNILISAISSCFSWLDCLFNAIPGAWDTIFTLITIIVISRFLLKPVVGFVFTPGSDKASKSNDGKSVKEEDTA